jgi:outer membrane protein OmpA-like peptidoglycan-associated protein
MERAAAVLVGGIGLVLLILAAVAVVGDDPDRSGGGVDLALFATTAPMTGATVLGATASSTSSSVAAAVPPPTAAGTSPAAGPFTTTTTPTTTTAVVPSTAAPAPPSPAPKAPAAPAPAPALTPELVEAVRLVSEGGVRFAVGRAQLDETAATRLRALAAELRARPDVGVVVVGHTDSTGGEEVNRPLSARRAQAVVDFLISCGVQPGQLRAEGLGPDRPVADNETVAGRQANRRSEVSVEPGR